MAPNSDNQAPAGAAECPVDHKSREVWLAQAKAAGNSSAAHPPPPPPQPAAPSASTWNPATWRIPFFSSPSATNPSAQPPHPRTTPNGLDEHREVSSIPRSSTPGPSACPVNSEAETGADAATGNWVYPSQKMFFEALKRKGKDAEGARAADMRTVVPIHNAVNERAWREIKEWEAPYTGQGKCDGPKLESFSGLATKMSPKARINTWLGYTAPFDRHDWVVDRCGTKVEYVIDFYAGRPSAPANPAAQRQQQQQQLNFFLDVRPKLNTWEGVKMRALRAVGAV